MKMQLRLFDHDESSRPIEGAHHDRHELRDANAHVARTQLDRAIEGNDQHTALRRQLAKVEPGARLRLVEGAARQELYDHGIAEVNFLELLDTKAVAGVQAVLV